jgi:hypothetical protein
MELILNQQKIELDTTGIDVFSNLIRKIEVELLEPHGEVLTLIQLNGQELDEQQERNFQNFPIAHISKIEVCSRNTKELTLEGLQDAFSIIPQINKQIDLVVDTISSDAGKIQFNELLVVIDGLSWFFTITESARTFFKPKFAQLREHLVLNNLSQLSAALPELERAYAEQDSTILCDLLEYEIKENLENILINLPSFIDELKS